MPRALPDPTAEMASQPGPSDVELPTGRRLERMTILYAFAVVGTLALIRLIGEQWWPVTLLVFSPRWLFLLPLPALVLAAGVTKRRRLWIAHGTLALAVAGPLMLVSIHFGRTRATRPNGLRLRIMTRMAPG